MAFKYQKIQELMGVPSIAVAAPDFLFEIAYCKQMEAKFEEARAGRDLIYAFHGSRLENFHSILHNGLQCHLNKVRALYPSPAMLEERLVSGALQAGMLSPWYP